MPFDVLCHAMVASPELNLSGPICVKSNLTVDSAGVDFPKQRVDFWVP